MDLRNRARRGLACVCTVLLAVPAFGQAPANPPESPAETERRTILASPSDPVTSVDGTVPSATDSAGRSWPASAFRNDPAFGVRQRTLFRDTGSPFTQSLRPGRLGATISDGSIDAGASIDLPDAHGRFPLLDRGFEPQDADLKIGPLFFKVRALSAGILASDNVNREEDDRESGTIAITRITGTVYAQITESLQLSTSGNYTFLPFKGEGGFGGFSLLEPLYSLGLSANSAAEAQISWDTMIAGWNVVFADDFRASGGRALLGSRDDFELFEGTEFDESDRAGRYVFRPRGRERHERDQIFLDDTDIDVIPRYYANTVSVATERLLPGPARLQVRAYHTNLWYNQGNRGNPDLRGNDRDRDPRTLEGLIASLKSERDNLRFQPSIYYAARRSDIYKNFNQEIRFALDGPITEQLDFHGDVGIHIRGETGKTSFLYALELNHQAGPYTRESLVARRSVLDTAEVIVDHVTYRIKQILGPKIAFEAYGSVGRVMDLDNEDEKSDFVRAGARTTFYAGPRTTLRASYIYSNYSNHGFTDFGDEDDDDDEFLRDSDRVTHTVRLELTYNFTDNIRSSLLYQYQKRDSTRDDDSYYENLIYLQLTKYFD